MVGLVVASHGHFAQELVATARQIIGEFPKVASCSVEPHASPEQIKQHIGDAVRQVDDGEGVVVFADLIGGSPCTQSLSLCRESRIEVLTGVNLPMLLKASTLRSQRAGGSLADFAHELAQHGRKHITCATDALRGERAAS